MSCKKDSQQKVAWTCQSAGPDEAVAVRPSLMLKGITLENGGVARQSPERKKVGLKLPCPCLACLACLAFFTKPLFVRLRLLALRLPRGAEVTLSLHAAGPGLAELRVGAEVRGPAAGAGGAWPSLDGGSAFRQQAMLSVS